MASSQLQILFHPRGIEQFSSQAMHYANTNQAFTKKAALPFPLQLDLVLNNSPAIYQKQFIHIYFHVGLMMKYYSMTNYWIISKSLKGLIIYSWKTYIFLQNNYCKVSYSKIEYDMNLK